MTVDDNAIMQAINSRHEENRSDIRELIKVSNRTASAQERTDDKLERVCMIVEGDGNGNPGLVRKVDKIEANVQRMADMQDRVFDAAKATLEKAWRLFWKIVVPIAVGWAITWFSSPTLRNFVHKYTVETSAPSIPPHTSTAQPQDAGNSPAYTATGK